MISSFLFVWSKFFEKYIDLKFIYFPAIYESKLSNFIILFKMSHRQPTQYPNLSNRPLSPKLNPSSNITPYSQHSLSTNLSHYSHKNHYESDQISMIHKENSVLREENQALKRQLIFMKKEGMIGSNSSNQQNSKEMNDMRETIKKEAG